MPDLEAGIRLLDVRDRLRVERVGDVPELRLAQASDRGQVQRQKDADIVATDRRPEPVEPERLSVDRRGRDDGGVLRMRKRHAHN